MTFIIHWITGPVNVLYELVDDNDNDVTFSLNEPIEGGPDNWQLGRGVMQGRYIGGSSLHSLHF
jgi:hypothetical protein